MFGEHKRTTALATPAVSTSGLTSLAFLKFLLRMTSKVTSEDVSVFGKLGATKALAGAANRLKRNRLLDSLIVVEGGRNGCWLYSSFFVESPWEPR